MEIRLSRFGLAALALVSVAGCTIQGGARAAVEPTVVAEQQQLPEPQQAQQVIVERQQPVVAWQEPPTVVQVEPQVYVVEQSPYPVYYVDRSYWQLRGGVWFRAGYYNDPWVRVDVHQVPRRIVHYRHDRYVHYQRHPGARTYREPYRPGRYHAPRHHDHDRSYDRTRYDDDWNRRYAPSPRRVTPHAPPPPRPVVSPHHPSPPKVPAPKSKKRRDALPPLPVPAPTQPPHERRSR